MASFRGLSWPWADLCAAGNLVRKPQPPLRRDKYGVPRIHHIRTKGNEANHQIVIMSKEDGEQLITMVEMLLKNIFELPYMIKTVKT